MVEDSGRERNLVDLLMMGFERFWKGIVTVYGGAIVLISILFWAGVISPDPNIPVDSLWGMAIGLRLSYYGIVVIAATLVTIIVLISLFYMGSKAIFNGDWEWFTGIEGITLLAAITVIGSIFWIIVTTDRPPFSAVLTGVIYWPWILGFLFAGVRGVPRVISYFVDLGAHYRSEAASGAVYGKGTGFWLLIVSLTIGYLSVFNEVGMDGQLSTPEGVIMILGSVAYIGNVVGIYLDLQETGLYEGLMMRYVYVVLAVVPGFGYFVTTYYLLRRQLSAFTSSK